MSVRTNQLPSGEVAFCFTDIEGSTRLFARLGPAFLDLLEEHRILVRAAVAAHGGAEVKTEGDGFFLAFQHAAEAVAACVEIQRAQAEHPWPADAPLRVRIGVHVGRGEPREGDYLLFAVHEAARISAAAHGGQIVVSDATARAVDGVDLPGVTLRDLGEHQLKDLDPIRLHQVDAAGLERSFPPLRSIGSARGYVPSPTAPIIGRSDEVAAILSLLERGRLVTVSGAGGIGKTRLAVEVAHGLLGARADGVWFIDLAPVADPDRLDDLVLDALGIVQDGSAPARTQVLTHLARRQLVLVLDNCEHLVEPVSVLVEALLRAGPGVTVVATSREPLGLEGEQVWRLRSLDHEAAVELFASRAALVRPELADVAANDPDVARIVDQLDGIPLAIELAAARVRVLNPAQIADRLDDRFRLLTGGRRNALARHRTLEAAVDWSYELLDDDERSLLRHLSVFAGGFDLEGAATVWERDPLDELERLVDKSMVQASLAGTHVRYRLLETIRDYAWRKLVDSGDASAARDRHLLHCVAVARTAVGLLDEREVPTAAAIAAELDNLRSGLEWAFTEGDAGAALEIVAHLWLHHAVAGRASEGLEQLRRAFEAGDGRAADEELLALAHAGAAHLSLIHQDPNEVSARHATWTVERARRRAAGEPKRWYDAWALLILAQVTGEVLGHDREAAEEAVAWADEAGMPFVRALALDVLGGAAGRAGLDGGSVVHCEEAVAVARAGGAASILAYTLCGLASQLVDAGRIPEAVAAGAEAVEAARRSPNVWFMAFALTALGQAKASRGDADACVPLADASALALAQGLEFPQAAAEIELGGWAIAAGDAELARRAYETAQAALLRVAAHRPEMLLLAGEAGHLLGEVAELEGDPSAAREIYEATLATVQGLGIGWVTGYARCSLGWLALADGAVDEAERHFVEAAGHVDGDAAAPRPVREIAARALRGLAAVALARGDARRAAERSGAASEVPEPSTRGSRLAWRRHVSVVDGARAALGDDAFEEAWAAGRAAGLPRTLSALPEI